MDYFEPKIIVIAVCTMVFLAIVLDIVRRRKRNRYENLQMPRDLDRSASPDFDKDPFSESQFPSGGARIVSRDGDHDFSERIENEKQNTLFDQPEQGTLALDNEPVAKPAVTAPQKVQAKEKPEERPKKSPQQEVLVIHLMTASNQTCSGQLLLDALLEQGLRYGEMKIFHRHTDVNGSGPVLFSLANVLKPGTFDLANMGQQELAGVTLFMTPSELEKPAEVFDLMIQTAENIAEKLQLNMMDESRSSMTKQTIDHYRQRAQQAILFQERSG